MRLAALCAGRRGRRVRNLHDRRGARGRRGQRQRVRANTDTDGAQPADRPPGRRRRVGGAHRGPPRAPTWQGPAPAPAPLRPAPRRAACSSWAGPGRPRPQSPPRACRSRPSLCPHTWGTPRTFRSLARPTPSRPGPDRGAEPPAAALRSPAARAVPRQGRGIPAVQTPRHARPGRGLCAARPRVTARSRG